MKDCLLISMVLAVLLAGRAGTTDVPEATVQQQEATVLPADATVQQQEATVPPADATAEARKIKAMRTRTEAEATAVRLSGVNSLQCDDSGASPYWGEADSRYEVSPCIVDALEAKRPFRALVNRAAYDDASLFYWIVGTPEGAIYAVEYLCYPEGGGDIRSWTCSGPSVHLCKEAAVVKLQGIEVLRCEQ